MAGSEMITIEGFTWWPVALGDRRFQLCDHHVGCRRGQRRSAPTRYPVAMPFLLVSGSPAARIAAGG
jgi:hypothetical protein